MNPARPVEQEIRQLAPEEFADLLRFVWPGQQDAYRLVRLCDAGLGQVLKLQARDITEQGITLGGQRRNWPGDEEGLRDRMLARAQYEPRDTGRVFEGHKPVFKAEMDLAATWQKTSAARQTARDLEGANPDAPLPGLVVLGAPRCATTWLYDSLALHPDVLVTQPKEPEFFGSERWELGLGWYRGQFAAHAGQPVVADVSVGYLASPEAPARIKQVLGDRDPTLVVHLREPVDRALSHYRLRLLRGEAPTSFEQAINLGYFRRIFLDEGRYVRGLERFLEHFPLESFHFVVYDRVREDPLAVLAGLAERVGLDAGKWDAGRRQASGRSYDPRSLALNSACYTLGSAAMRYVPHYGLAKSVRQTLRDLNRRWNRRPRRPQTPISPELRARLREGFREDNQALARLTGLDLSAWND